MPYIEKNRVVGFSSAVLGPDRGRGAAIVSAARRLGLNRVEIGATLDCDPAASLAGAFRGEGIQVTSLHNVVNCGRAIPDGSAAEGSAKPFLQGDALMDPSSAIAELGLEMTLETVRTGEILGAPLVILHAGTFFTEELHDIKKKAAELFNKEGRTEEVQRLVTAGLQIVQLQKTEYLERAVRVLYGLLKTAPETTFCLETRYNFFEAPDIEMMECILDDQKSPRLAYWHDTGHAHAQEVLGLATHEQWLDRFAPRMAGAHLHDAVGLDDHMPPGSGRIDFQMVGEATPSGAVGILEIGPEYGVEGAAMGLGELKKMNF